MQREIKFRGKRTYGKGDWVVGYLVSGGLFGGSESACWIFYDKHFVEIMPESIGQFTGLKDKKGNEIYEGDILKAFSVSVPSYEVFYSRNSYRLRYKLSSSEYYDWGPLFRMEEIFQEGHLKMHPEVIGNIYDNPELLNPSQKGEG